MLGNRLTGLRKNNRCMNRHELNVASMQEKCTIPLVEYKTIKKLSINQKKTQQPTSVQTQIHT